MTDGNITQREQEILCMMAGGMSSKEIADALFISIHTVLTHRKNILRKLNKNNSIGAINAALCLGIISQKNALLAVPA